MRRLYRKADLALSEELWKIVLFMSPVALGLVAGAFTTFASLPQIVYVLKTRSTKDISLITLLMFMCGVTLWLCYGIVIHATPVIFWNALSLSLYITQIALKISIESPRPLGLFRRMRATISG